MTAACGAAPMMPWGGGSEEDRRFLRILAVIVAVFIAFGGIVPYIEIPELTRAEMEEVPPRLAQLMMEKKKPAPPVPVEIHEPEKPAAQDKPEPEPEPEQEKPPVKLDKKTQAAREKAAKSGLLAMKDALADLRQRPVMEDLTGMKLDKGTARAKEKKRSIITAEAEQRSGGIDTSGLTRDSGEVAMAGHDTTRVEAPQGAAATGGGGEDKPSRSIEEVQLVFDKNKGAIYAIYNRILRRNPTLSGKVVLELTIAPSGEVTECTVVSSELKSPTFLRKLVARVKFFRFQAKDVDPMVVTYPIDFLPSS